MKKRIWIAVSVITVLSLLFSGCGSRALPKDAAGYVEAEATFQKTDTIVPNAAASNPAADSQDFASPELQNSQKLIKTLRISLETLEFEESLNKLNALIFEKGGYIESSTVSGTSYNNRAHRTAQYVIRIPAEQLDQAESDLGKLGNVISSTSEVSDVSLTWADTESKIKALEVQRDSLLSMLEKADNLTDLLQIQDHLTEVEYRLESAASQMRVLENQVSYSTIRLNLEEVRVYTEEEPETFGQRISRTFKSSLESVGEFFTDLAVFVAGNLPVILCWAAVIVLTILGIRKITRKNRKKASAAPVVPLSEPPENPPFKQP